MTKILAKFHVGSSFIFPERIKPESSFCFKHNSLCSVSFGMTNYPQMGVAKVTWPLFKFLGTIISVQRVKLNITNLVSTSINMIDWSRIECVSGSRDFFKFKFRYISDNYTYYISLWVSEWEFNVPFQHKHGYIRDEHKLIWDGTMEEQLKPTRFLCLKQ